MSKQVYIATIQIAVAAVSQADACDGISEILSGEHFPFVLDWAYLKLGSQLQYPTRHDHIAIEGYEEGDFLG